MTIATQKEISIGELVALDFRTAEIFKKYKIDFCCGGKKTLSQVCEEKKIDRIEIQNKLNDLTNDTNLSSQNYNNWSLDFLVDYIINTHHNYVKTSIPIILEYTNKIAKVHGENHPELIAINNLFKEATAELEAHMVKEETILFPYIKELVSSSNKTKQNAICDFGTIKNPIRMMEHEHDVVGDIFKTMRELSNNYTPPDDGCTTYKVAFLKLNEFEADLHQHIHLENNILFPKSIKLESQLF